MGNSIAQIDLSGFCECSDRCAGGSNCEMEIYLTVSFEGGKEN